MKSNVVSALVDMMNDARDPNLLRDMTQKVFGGVIPLRKSDREDHEAVVRIAVTLLSNGISPKVTAEQIVKSTKVRRDAEWTEKAVTGVMQVAQDRAQHRPANDLDLNLEIAVSYVDVIRGRASPTESLEQAAINHGKGEPDYNAAGRTAMVETLDALMGPQTIELTPNVVRLWAAINAKIEAAARLAADAEKFEDFCGAEVDDNGRVYVNLSNRGGLDRTVEISENGNDNENFSLGV